MREIKKARPSSIWGTWREIMITEITLFLHKRSASCHFTAPRFPFARARACVSGDTERANGGWVSHKEKQSK